MLHHIYLQDGCGLGSIQSSHRQIRFCSFPPATVPQNQDKTPEVKKSEREKGCHQFQGTIAQNWWIQQKLWKLRQMGNNKKKKKFRAQKHNL